MTWSSGARSWDWHPASTPSRDQVLDDRVAEGRYTAGLVSWIRELGDDLVRRITAGERLWDDRWVSWEPPAGWASPVLPNGWHLLG